jgi:hypothetical protein
VDISSPGFLFSGTGDNGVSMSVYLVFVCDTWIRIFLVVGNPPISGNKFPKKESPVLLKSYIFP